MIIARGFHIRALAFSVALSAIVVLLAPLSRAQQPAYRLNHPKRPHRRRYREPVVSRRPQPCAATGSRGSPFTSRRRLRARSTSRGQIVAPGFIDIHSHARGGIFEVPTAENYIRQGVTTIIEGPDGSSPIPAEAVSREGGRRAHHRELRDFHRTGVGPRRGDRSGESQGHARGSREHARRWCAPGHADGAFGLSTGLFYVPGRSPRPPKSQILRGLPADGRHPHLAHARGDPKS